MYFLSLLAQAVKIVPAMRETRVRCLGQKDPLEKAMATHFTISCLGNHRERGTWRTTVMGSESDTTE